MAEEAAFRVAVISRDGVSVNERLHRAADLFVFERAGERVEFVARRTLPPSKMRVFRDFPSLVTQCGDCRWIVALGFTGEARKELSARGFRLHEARGAIEQVIRTLPGDTLAAPPAAAPP